jgi:hypothetical protein
VFLPALGGVAFTHPRTVNVSLGDDLSLRNRATLAFIQVKQRIRLAAPHSPEFVGQVKRIMKAAM